MDARRLGLSLVFLLATAVTACSTATAKIPPGELLAKAKAELDGSTSVHFVLTSSDVSTSGTNITGGDGDLARPDQMQGSFDVTVSGFVVNVKVVSKNGVFEALLPFQTRYEKTNPATYGLTDPAQLLSPTKGLTNLLTLATNPTLGASERIGGELLETVTFTVPGSAVPVLPDAKPSVPVELTVAVNPHNFQVRQIALVGPFTSATSNSTYVVALSNYDERVSIALPPSS